MTAETELRRLRTALGEIYACHGQAKTATQLCPECFNLASHGCRGMLAGMTVEQAMGSQPDNESPNPPPREESMEYIVEAVIPELVSQKGTFGPFAERPDADQCVLVLAARPDVLAASVKERVTAANPSDTLHKQAVDSLHRIRRLKEDMHVLGVCLSQGSGTRIDGIESHAREVLTNPQSTPPVAGPVTE